MIYKFTVLNSNSFQRTERSSDGDLEKVFTLGRKNRCFLGNISTESKQIVVLTVIPRLIIVVRASWALPGG